MRFGKVKVLMKSFFECSFFSDTNAVPVGKRFTVYQSELVLNPNGNKTSDGKFSFSKIDVDYLCQWMPQTNFDSEKTTILIPIRDNADLLTVTVNNLKEHNIDSLCNVVIIDDRSEEDIREITINNELSYLRVDNEKGFNFSMLNNIPAKICNDMGVENIILWNSDLWCVKREWLENIINKHNEDKSVLSGAKLVYPPVEHSMTKEEDSENIVAHFPHMSGGKWRDTVQFGGDRWNINAGQPVLLSPQHYGRFLKKDDKRVDCDRGSSFITGAFQILDLKYFIKLGGLNPSLSKNFQDTDLCLRCVQDDKIPMYYGKDGYFYHDESLNFYNIEKSGKGKKKDGQLVSDFYLFGRIWNNLFSSLGLI